MDELAQGRVVEKSPPGGPSRRRTTSEWEVVATLAGVGALASLFLPWAGMPPPAPATEQGIFALMTWMFVGLGSRRGIDVVGGPATALLLVGMGLLWLPRRRDGEAHRGPSTAALVASGLCFAGAGAQFALGGAALVLAPSPFVPMHGWFVTLGACSLAWFASLRALRRDLLVAPLPDESPSGGGGAGAGRRGWLRAGALFGVLALGATFLPWMSHPIAESIAGTAGATYLQAQGAAHQAIQDRFGNGVRGQEVAGDALELCLVWGACCAGLALAVGRCGRPHLARRAAHAARMLLLVVACLLVLQALQLFTTDGPLAMLMPRLAHGWWTTLALAVLATFCAHMACRRLGDGLDAAR